MYGAILGDMIGAPYECVLRRPAAADADLNGRDAAWRPA